MKNKKFTEIYNYLAYISAGLSLLSIIFYFYGTFVGNYNHTEGFFSLIDMFKYYSLNKTGSNAYLILSILFTCALLFSAVSAVLNFFKVKTAKIISSALLFFAFILDLIVLIYIIEVVETENVISISFGIILILILLIASIIFSLISLVFYIGLLKDREKEIKSQNVKYNFNTKNFTNNGRIKFLSGSCSGYVIPVEPNKHVIIGKDPACCSIVISKKYSAVSRKHCDISFDPNLDMYIVKDCSSNGTFTENGIRLHRNADTRIRRGTMISIARTDNILFLE